MQLDVNQVDKERAQEKDSQQVVRVIWMKVRTVRDGIRSSKEVAWDVNDFEIKISEIKQPLSLAVVEVLGLTEVCQVLVVSEDLDREWGSMEIMSPGF